MIYRGEFAQGYNARPNPLDRALAAAQRAVDLAPTNALCHYALATVYYFRKVPSRRDLLSCSLSTRSSFKNPWWQQRSNWCSSHAQARLTRVAALAETMRIFSVNR
jgi:hypothetical protein